MKFTLGTLLLIAAVCVVSADTYLQNPEGSNNRNREAQQKVANNKRCFYTQNNGAGGYGIRNERLTLYAGTTMMIDWTVQHGSGRGEQKADFVVQALWANDQDPNESTTVRDGEVGGNGQETDGLSENNNQELSNIENESLADALAKSNQGGTEDKCRYESIKSFWNCSHRNRNANLYTGNDTPAGATAMSTRQQDNDPRGVECEEERSYYPYWHPSDFRDIVVYKHNETLCSEVQANSQNVVGKHLCIGDGSAADPAAAANNAADCSAAGGAWTETPAWGIPAPECKPAFMSRINHLGNTCGEGLPELERYNWTIPSDMEGPMQVRIRYNISVDELEHTADAGDDDNVLINGGDAKDADIGEGITLTLTFATNQIFRTFQDRSGLSNVLPAPDAMAACAKTHVVKTRGGRGNIVQAYPGTEYDFAPNKLTMERGDCMHLTWAGSDAWTGDDEGQGDAEDHHNFVQMASLSSIRPLTIADMTFPPASAMPVPAADQAAARLDWIKKAATGCSTDPNYGDEILNNVPYACDLGILGPFTEDDTWFFFCTRNTNFTNRSQKASISVVASLSAFGTASILVGVFVLGAGVVAAGSMFYAKGHPNSTVARIFQNGGSRGSGILSSTGSQGRGSRSGSHGSRSRSSRSGSRGSKGGRSRGSKGSGYARH